MRLIEVFERGAQPRLAPTCARDRIASVRIAAINDRSTSSRRYARAVAPTTKPPTLVLNDHPCR